ncbi:MAG TPA: rhomboid family intramembrane serine protease [Bacteroidales bacterium]|nr:rhomboid family intramembrane serine protease [Bacteroidales bacterium]
MEETDYKYFRKKILLSSLLPFFLVTIMWLVKISESVFGIELTRFGIYPLTFEGLPGIILSPFIHDDYRHIFNNTLPLFFLMVALFYFYPDQAIKIFLWTYLFTGVLVWFFGRSAWHIGASGLVYGIASFHFFSGIIRKYFRLIALSMLIVFLYGSMVWGLFPDFYRNVSWESHMLGFVSGVVLALVYRNEGPQPPSYEWMEEDDEDEDDENGDPGTMNKK